MAKPDEPTPVYPGSGDGGSGSSGGVESRIAKLEATTEHILRELLDIKRDLLELRQEMRAEFRDIRANARSDFRTLLGFGIAAVTGLIGVMAHGFHWIP